MNDSAIIEIIDLHPFEINLLKAIREKWRYGEIVIQVRDGLPFRLRRVVEFEDLTKPVIPNSGGIDIVEKKEYNITN